MNDKSDTGQVTGQPGRLREIKLEWQLHNRDHGMSWNEVAELFNQIQSLFTFTDEIEQIISEVDDMHPYKKPGVRESYYEYAEGWSDACDELGDRIKAAMNKLKS